MHIVNCGNNQFLKMLSLHMYANLASMHDHALTQVVLFSVTSQGTVTCMCDAYTKNNASYLKLMFRDKQRHFNRIFVLKTLCSFTDI